MKDRRRLYLGFAAFLLIVVSAGYGHARNEESAALAKQIRDKIEALHQMRAKRLVEHQSHRDRLAQVDRQIQRLQEDKSRVQKLVKANFTSVQALKQEAKTSDSERIAAELLLADMAKEALPLALRCQARIQNGIPFLKEDRGARIDGIVQDLKGSSVLKQGRALVEFFSLAGEELRHARGIEFWNSQLQVDQQKIHAYVARFGLVNQIYISEDGRDMGVFDPKAKGSWRRDLSKDEKNQLLIALQTLQGRRPPEISPLPFLSGAGQ
jgi:hypothetical protein